MKPPPALDNETEAAIMDSINRLHGRKTLIIIAHRLQTIEKCDMVYRVENGQIGQGEITLLFRVERRKRWQQGKRDRLILNYCV